MKVIHTSSFHKRTHKFQGNWERPAHKTRLGLQAINCLWFPEAGPPEHLMRDTNASSQVQPILVWAYHFFCPLTWNVSFFSFFLLKLYRICLYPLFFVNFKPTTLWSLYLFLLEPVIRVWPQPGFCTITSQKHIHFNQNLIFLVTWFKISVLGWFLAFSFSYI